MVGAGVAALALEPKLLGRKLPIHQMVEEGLEEILAPVLIVEIVGVLPDVAGQYRVPDRNHGRLAVWR